MPCSTTKVDADLFRGLRDGDIVAFEEVYARFAPVLYQRLLRLLKNTDNVEEILQDTFLKLWEKREQIDPHQGFKAYLYRIADHLAINLFRKISRKRTLQLGKSGQGNEKLHYPINPWRVHRHLIPFIDCQRFLILQPVALRFFSFSNSVFSILKAYRQKRIINLLPLENRKALFDLLTNHLNHPISHEEFDRLFIKLSQPDNEDFNKVLHQVLDKQPDTANSDFSRTYTSNALIELNKINNR